MGSFIGGDGSKIVHSLDTKVENRTKSDLRRFHLCILLLDYRVRWLIKCWHRIILCKVSLDERSVVSWDRRDILCRVDSEMRGLGGKVEFKILPGRRLVLFGF